MILVFAVFAAVVAILGHDSYHGQAEKGMYVIPKQTASEPADPYVTDK